MASAETPIAGEPKPKSRAGRKPSGARKPDASVIVHCYWEWKSAVDTMARNDNLSMSDLVSVALAEYAKKHKHEPLPVRVSTPGSR